MNQSTETIASGLSSLASFESRIDWPAVQYAAKDYLFNNFREKRNRREAAKEMLEFRQHVLSTLYSFRSTEELDAKLEEFCDFGANGAFLMLVEEVTRVKQWPNLIRETDPEAAFWKGRALAAEKRFNRPIEQIPDYLLQVIDLEYLHLPSSVEKLRIEIILLRYMLLMAAASKQFGKPFEKIPPEKYVTFEVRHESTSLDELANLAGTRLDLLHSKPTQLFQ